MQKKGVPLKIAEAQSAGNQSYFIISQRQWKSIMTKAIRSLATQA
jgi:hypothetical protein